MNERDAVNHHDKLGKFKTGEFRYIHQWDDAGFKTRVADEHKQLLG